MPPNLVMITLDGLRSDKLHMLDSVDALASESQFFSNMVTAAPYTIASMHAIFSGVYPYRNGVNGYYNMARFRSERYKSIARYLADAGYYCIADVINHNVLPKEGFHSFSVHDENKDDLTGRHKDLLDQASQAQKPWFLYLHYSNIHTQLIANVQKKYNDFSEEFFASRDTNESSYHRYIGECDRYLGAILEHMKALGLNEDTITLVLSDHGVSLGEKKGERLYGCFLFDYTLRTFCMLKDLRRGYPSRIEYQTRTIDVLPTILELLSVPEDKQYQPTQGKSLMSFVRGDERGDRLAYSETGGLGGPWPSPYAHNVFSVRISASKLVYYQTPSEWEFYDLASDPNEANPQNNTGSLPEKSLRKELGKILLEQRLRKAL